MLVIGILFFPVVKVRKCEIMQWKKRANEKVKTQNDLSLHATLRNDRGGPKNSIFFFFGDEEEEEQVECTGIQSFPPSDIRHRME